MTGKKKSKKRTDYFFSLVRKARASDVGVKQSRFGVGGQVFTSLNSYL